MVYRVGPYRCWVGGVSLRRAGAAPGALERCATEHLRRAPSPVVRPADSASAGRGGSGSPRSPHDPSHRNRPVAVSERRDARSSRRGAAATPHNFRPGGNPPGRSRSGDRLLRHRPCAAAIPRGLHGVNLEPGRLVRPAPRHPAMARVGAGERAGPRARRDDRKPSRASRGGRYPDRDQLSCADGRRGGDRRWTVRGHQHIDHAAADRRRDALRPDQRALLGFPPSSRRLAGTTREGRHRPRILCWASSPWVQPRPDHQRTIHHHVQVHNYNARATPRYAWGVEVNGNAGTMPRIVHATQANASPAGNA